MTVTLARYGSVEVIAQGPALWQVRDDAGREFWVKPELARPARPTRKARLLARACEREASDSAFIAFLREHATITAQVPEHRLEHFLRAFEAATGYSITPDAPGIQRGAGLARHWGVTLCVRFPKTPLCPAELCPAESDNAMLVYGNDFCFELLALGIQFGTQGEK